MPNFAANLTTMFIEVDFLDRFTAAAQAGFKAVEYQFPYDISPEDIAERLDQNDLHLALFNMPAGNRQEGERGFACLPGRETEFDDTLENVLAYAEITNCRQIHMLAGIVPPGTSHQEAQQIYIRNLISAAKTCNPHGITVMIEPINLGAVPGYFLHRQDQAIELMKLADQPNVALQMDLYHCHLAEGDLAAKIRQNIGHISHFQITGAPGRHEPDTGGIDYPPLFELIDSLGYNGWIGCEYHPASQTQAGLAWAAKYIDNT